MNKETQKKLIKDFPKSVVKPAPKGNLRTMFLTFTLEIG